MPIRNPFALVLLFVLLMPAWATAQDNLQAAYDRAVAEKNHDKAAMFSYQLGQNLYDQNLLEEASAKLGQSITLSKKTGNQEQLLLSSHLMATVLLQQKEISRAEDQFVQTITIAKKTNRPVVAVESSLILAQLLSSNKKYRKAIDVLESALPLAIEHQLISSQLESYRQLTEYHLKAGNSKKSIEYRNLAVSLENLIENERMAAEKVNSLVTARESVEQQLIEQQQKLQTTNTILAGKDDSLRSAARSLHHVETSLRELEDLNQKRQLEIDLLSRDKELSALRIKDQDSQLKNEALFRNFVLAIALLVTALVIVIIRSNRKTVQINRKLDLQNKNIKSSINYAKRIQEAMLPKADLQEKHLPESFVLFKPRDVVSGDFYWFSQLHNGAGLSDGIAFGAIDCTGHGVPGAFMSMIGMNSLNRIVDRGIAQPDVMLNLLHQDIRQALKQETTGNNDGMDASICVFRQERNILEFAGAKSPLVYIRNDEVVQIKGDLHPIGGSKSKPIINFRKHEIIIDRPTMIYLFTDGFRDQFGGPENQKFMSRRFTQLLLDIHQLPMKEQKNALASAFESWKGTREQTDDVLVLGVRVNTTA